MKEKIKHLILQAMTCAHAEGELPSSAFPDVEVEEPKIETHGDFSSNIAMVSASVQKMAPRKIAETILKHIDDGDGILPELKSPAPAH